MSQSSSSNRVPPLSCWACFGEYLEKPRVWQLLKQDWKLTKRAQLSVWQNKTVNIFSKNEIKMNNDVENVSSWVANWKHFLKWTGPMIGNNKLRVDVISRTFKKKYYTNVRHSYVRRTHDVDWNVYGQSGQVSTASIFFLLYFGFVLCLWRVRFRVDGHVIDSGFVFFFWILKKSKKMGSL